MLLTQNGHQKFRVFWDNNFFSKVKYLTLIINSDSISFSECSFLGNSTKSPSDPTRAGLVGFLELFFGFFICYNKTGSGAALTKDLELELHSPGP